MIDVHVNLFFNKDKNLRKVINIFLKTRIDNFKLKKTKQKNKDEIEYYPKYFINPTHTFSVLHGLNTNTFNKTLVTGIGWCKKIKILTILS